MTSQLKTQAGNLAILEGGRVYQNSGQSLRIVGQGDLGIKGVQVVVPTSLQSKE